LILQLAVPVGVLIMVYAGFLMVTAAGNMGKVTEGRKLMTQVLTGFVIMLMGWMIINTLIKSLARSAPEYNFDTSKWYQVRCK
jgi:xanthine/uracil permease